MRDPLTFLAVGLLLLTAGCGAPTPTLAASLTAPAPTASPLPSVTPVSAPTATVPPTNYHPELVEGHPELVEGHPELVEGHPEPVEGQPELVEGTFTITLSADGVHAFPVAGDLALLTWTHDHWDGSIAVDIEAARGLPGDSEAFLTFTQLPVVAVVSGTVAIADNPAGGLALLLYGDDGYTYYYGHLSEQWVEDGQAIGVGDGLGRIGNTGRWTQYIEPHLHFSIATHQAADWRWEPDVNAAEQFLAWFDLPWQDLEVPDYPPDHVAGWPLAVPAQIVRGFTERQAENPDQGSLDIVPAGAGGEPLPVYATLGGEVNVNRATVMGLRVQVTNRPARTTVVYSFMLEATVADGDVVQRGDLVGYIDPAVGLNYMLFLNDLQTDPAPTLGAPPQ